MWSDRDNGVDEMTDRDGNDAKRPWNEDIAPSIEKMQAILETKDREIASYVDRLKRLQAEFDNFRKRSARDAADCAERTVDRTLLDVLPIYDNLRRAFAALADDGDAASFIEGTERIFAQFAALLEERRVAPIPAIGEPFDPKFHEALLGVPSDRPRHVILEEFERGYCRDGRVLRPSKVKVSQGQQEPEEGNE